MLHHPVAKALPRISIRETDKLRLTAIATLTLATEEQSARRDIAHVLLNELERAEIVADEIIPTEVTRMNSTVEFQLDNKDVHTLRLVHPSDADVDAGKVSVLTPIGAALIGLRPGQMMMLRSYLGNLHKVRVISVSQLSS